MDNQTIYIADKQAIVRSGVSAIIKEAFGSLADIEDFCEQDRLLERIRVKRPDALIIDFDWLTNVFIDSLTEMADGKTFEGVLALTTNQSSERIHQILDWGITSCVLKSCEQQELIDAAHATIMKKKYFCSGVLTMLLSRKTSKRKYAASPERITPSEQEIIQLIAQGLSSKEIAVKKSLSYHTIITHRKNIFRKLAINNSSELMLYAMHTGIIDDIDFSI